LTSTGNRGYGATRGLLQFGIKAFGGASPRRFRPTYPDFLHGAPPTPACAAFIKESRIKCANASTLDRKSGVRSGERGAPVLFPARFCDPVRFATGVSPSSIQFPLNRLVSFLFPTKFRPLEALRPKGKLQIPPLRSPRFPVELGCVGKFHAAFFKESRIRGRCECRLVGNLGTLRSG